MADIVERLEIVEAAEREVSLGLDMRPEDTANYEYAETCHRAAAEIKRLRIALEDVLNPLDHLRRHAEASGGRLNERAHGIANSLTYVQDIARNAIRANGVSNG